jgi:hypothetical protein
MSLLPGVLNITIDNRDSVSVNNRWAFKKADWSQRNVVSWTFDHALHFWHQNYHFLSCFFFLCCFFSSPKPIRTLINVSKN